jgi:hypothetical protein
VIRACSEECPRTLFATVRVAVNFHAGDRHAGDGCRRVKNIILNELRYVQGVAAQIQIEEMLIAPAFVGAAFNPRNVPDTAGFGQGTAVEFQHVIMS